MEKEMFTKILHRVRDYAAGMGLVLIDSKTLNPYFKGDLNGTKLWINFDMDDEEELFNVLHMIGHAIQWGVSKELRELGSVLHTNPDNALLRKLQEYEWEANCYGLQVLHDLGIFRLDDWMFEKYELDMTFLTHFYLTGQKFKSLKQIPIESKCRTLLQPLIPKPVPKSFIPTEIEGSRDGVVIDF